MQIFKNIHNLCTKFRIPNPKRPLIITQYNRLGQTRLFAPKDFTELSLRESFKTSKNYHCWTDIPRKNQVKAT